MTELEQQLLSAFEQLQSSYELQQQEWQQACSSLQTMYERTSAETAALRQQVTSLSEQVENLSRRLKG